MKPGLIDNGGINPQQMSFNWAIAWVNRISVIPGVSDPAR